MSDRFSHNPVLTESQLSGQELSSGSIFIWVILGALALILANIVALVMGYQMLVDETKVLFYLGMIKITLPLIGMAVIALSVVPLHYAYKLLTKISQP